MINRVLAPPQREATPSWLLFPKAGLHQVPIDPNGNLTSKTEGTDTWGYEWNAETLLTKVEKNGAEVARFTYDPKGRRVEKVAGGVASAYTYDGEDILREVRGGSTLKYVHGRGVDEPLAAEEGGALSCFHSDHLGGIEKATSAAGVVTLTRRYDAWGNPELGASEPGYAFTGREWDPETGLYYYRARYYDPKIGRFLSEDPLGWPAGPLLYSYVGSNPQNRVDPLGLSAEDPNEPCWDQLQGCLGKAFGLWILEVIGCAALCEGAGAPAPPPARRVCTVVCVAAASAILMKNVDFCFDQYEDCQKKRCVSPPSPPTGGK